MNTSLKNTDANCVSTIFDNYFNISLKEHEGSSASNNTFTVSTMSIDNFDLHDIFINEISIIKNKLIDTLKILFNDICDNNLFKNQKYIHMIYCNKYN